jgi:serine/threonine protein kinase
MTHELTPLKNEVIPAMSISLDPAEGLLRTGVLEQPSHPGILANLGRYEILRIVGIGGMGVVLLARDPAQKAQVAIKLLKPEFLYNPTAVHRFLVEAHHMEKLDHPHILKVTEVCERTAGPYFVMPYLEKGSLAKILQTGRPLDEGFVQKIAIQIAQAIDYAHSRGIIHHDLKPGNILLDRDGNAYLADFGLVRTVFNDSIVDVQRTSCEGTAAYMSPGVAAGNVEDTRCDIYAFGSVLYEMLTGWPPYEGQTSQEILKKIISGPPVSIHEINPQAPEGLVRVTECAMARELRNRYTTMADVVADLDRVEHNQNPFGPHDQAAWNFLNIKRQTINLWMIMGIVIPVICVGILCFFLWAFWPFSQNGEKRSDLGKTQSAASFNNPAKVIDLPIQYSVQKKLFEDLFRGKMINDSLWSWDETNGQTYHGSGKQMYQVLQDNGTLMIRGQAISPDGLTSNQQVWLDSIFDFKSVDSSMIKLTFSAAAINGFIRVSFSPGTPILRYRDPEAVPLYEAQGNKNHPLKITPQEIIILTSKSQGKAIVWTPDNDSQILDIKNLSKWILRFHIQAHTSAGYSPDDVNMRLYKVEAWDITPVPCVMGSLIDSISNRPIAEASIFTMDKQSTVRSSRQGCFVLPVKSKIITLEVSSPNYQPVHQPLEIDEKKTSILFHQFLMEKKTFNYGDVIYSIPFLYQRIHSFTFKNDKIVFCYTDGEENILSQMDLAEESSSNIGRLNIHSSLEYVGNQLYATSRWDTSGLYLIDPPTTPKRLHDLPGKWLWGLAYDGKQFWLVENDEIDNRFGVFAIDEKSGQEMHHFVTTDLGICAIAYGKNHLWIASRSGCVYEVDPVIAGNTGRMETAIINKFKGYYSYLSFNDPYLWGLDNDAKRLCKIKVAP